jgi:drug/metabolite transporter (DMT)-like permease
MRSNARAGLVLGLVGVLCFSVTLPATRVAVPELGPTIVGLGRGGVAAALAAVLLAVRRERVPREHLPGLFLSGLGIVIGFPLLSAIALKSVPAVHGAVVAGFLPAATAVFAVVRGGERPALRFWLGVLLGLVAIVVFAAVEGAGSLQPPDVFLLLAVACAGFGYAEGGRIGRDIGGWRAVCWSLVLVGPLLVIPVGQALVARGTLVASPAAWLCFAYVAAVSMFLGFFAWFAGLARGGIARVGQVQLIQAPLTLLWGALFLHERVAGRAVLAALLVVVSVAVTQRVRAAATPDRP